MNPWRPDDPAELPPMPEVSPYHEAVWRENEPYFVWAMRRFVAQVEAVEARQLLASVGLTREIPEPER